MIRREFLKVLAATSLLFGFKSRAVQEPTDNPENNLGSNDRIHAKNTTGLTGILSDVRTGDLVVIAGRPGSGKTAVAVNLLHELAVENKIDCAYFSLELTSNKIFDRLMSLMKGIPITTIGPDQVNMDQILKCSPEMDLLNEVNLNLNDCPNISNLSIKRDIQRKNFEGQNIKFVFIDYLQLMRHESPHSSISENVDEILAQLKETATSEKIAIVALAQSNSYKDKIDFFRTKKSITSEGYKKIDKYIFIDQNFATITPIPKQGLKFLNILSRKNRSNKLQSKTYRLNLATSKITYFS